MDNEEQRQSTHEEERKQASTRAPFSLLEQVHSDFTMAVALQEQERVFHNILTSIGESESNDGDDDDDEEEEEEEIESEGSTENNENDYEFFESQEFEGEMEGQDSNSDQDMEEDDIDPDELSYEELIALGEFIGEETRGLSLNEISTCLRPCKYQPLEHKNGIDRCVVCQVEYEEGESLVSLRCQHPYHSECISHWLQIKKICPICNIEVSSTKRC